MSGNRFSRLFNRAFVIFGLIFLFGGIYLALLLYSDPYAREVLSVTGTFISVRVEKERPLGFEYAPVDREDPQYDHIPLNTNTFGRVSYTVAGEPYQGDIVAWTDPVDWKEGESIDLYVLEGEHHIPLEYYPEEASGGRSKALPVGLGMGGAGLVLFLMGLYGGKRDLSSGLERAKAAYEKAALLPLSDRVGSREASLAVVNHGNYFMGVILLILGLILAATGAAALFSERPLYDRLLRLFPLFMGAGVLLLGLNEFSRERISLDGGLLRVKRSHFFLSHGKTAGLNTFAGIGENLYMRRYTGGGRARYYREYVLLHSDPELNNMGIARFNATSEGDREGECFARELGLPLLEHTARDSG